MRLLVTGGAGFIGSNFIHYWLKEHPEDHVINLDALTYAGNLENLREVENNPKYRFVKGDIRDMDLLRELMKEVDVVVNFAAESHNDRAVHHPEIFIETNVLGTQCLLQAALEAGNVRVHHISTCEVFGELGLNEDRAFAEDDAYMPRTPYNASKASANHVVMAYFHTYGLPVTISHCANNYGPYQFPEKLIPLFATNAFEDLPLPLFESSQNKREWIHVEDHCRGIDLILQKGEIGEAYNIGTRVEKSVEEITDHILDILGKPDSLKSYVPDRLGHDTRYLLDDSKLKKLGFEPKIGFEDGLRATIDWYKAHPQWWQPLKAKRFPYERHHPRRRNGLQARPAHQSDQQTSAANL